MNSKIKEFADEVEPEERKCLFCDDVAPNDILTDSMYHYKGWYSNALLNPQTKKVTRFYLCPKHRGRDKEAWDWARKEV